MNERIKLLAEQATRIRELAEQATELDYETFDNYNHKTVKQYKFNKEKFAELIVRECMDVCYRTDTEYEGHKVKSTVIASKVAEHFGVEE